MSFVEFPTPTPNSGPGSIAVGSDGNLWFTESAYGLNQIGRITTGGVITEIPVPGGHRPISITGGPDGNLWFVTSDGEVERVTTGGVFTAFPVPTSTPSLMGIAAGPDGNVWFVEQAGKIGRITPTGAITEFPVPGGTTPCFITAGSDGNLWFSDGVGVISRVTPTGVFAGFNTAPPLEQTLGLALGPDGNVWVAMNGYMAIGRVTPAGLITTFPVGVGPRQLTTGSDGNIWFIVSPPQPSAIGRITPAGVSAVFPFPNMYAGPFGIASGPDGNLWIAEASSNAIGRLTL